MKKNSIRKGLVFAIIGLFIVVSIIPGITGIEKISNISNNFANLYNIESNNCNDPPNKEWIKPFGGGDWNHTYGGSSYDEGYAVQQTNDGGYIIAGATLSFGAGDWDVWLIKTDSNGNEEWNSTFGGSGYDRGYSVQQTDEGGYIITGCTHSFGNGEFDVWLIKTDSNGNEEWNSTFGGISVDWGYTVEQTLDGGFIIAGYTDSFGAGDSDVWLIKTDSNGNEEWNSTFGGSSYDRGFSGQQTDDGSYIITGYTVSYNLDGTGCDVWLIKTDSNGNEEWNSTFGGTGIPNKFDMGYDVQQTDEGGYIIAGETEILYVSKSDVLLIKADSSGNEVWTETFGGSYADGGRSVQQTADGGYIIAGWAVSFGEPDPDVWLIKTNISGGEEWTVVFGFDVNSGDWGYAVEQTHDSGFIIVGATMPTGWMLNESYSSNKGEGTDVWLIKTFMGDNIPPTANFTFTPLHPCIGETVSFSDSSIDVDGSIISWSWIFDDGNISDNQNPTHQYVNNGTYLVNLEIRDDDNLSDNISKLLLIGGTFIENLSFEWNFVSMPFNQTINKTDIIFFYNNSYHSWQDACNDSVVLEFIYGWNRSNQNYLTTDILHPGFGYWLYAYVDCELWLNGISGNTTDDYITNLLAEWNIVGVPDDESLDKQNLTVFYNGTYYNWTEATTGNNPILVSYVFGFNRTFRLYEAIDELIPGHCYWMYAYYNCTIYAFKDNFTIRSKYNYFRSYRNGGGIFPVYIITNDYFDNDVFLTINADSNLTAVLDKSILNSSSRVAELTIRPNNNTLNGNHTIDLTATQGNESQKIYLLVEIINISIGEPNVWITDKKDEFFDWLAIEHPEFGNLSNQTWFSYKTYPQIIIVSHWTFLSSEWEFRICCHITIPPNNWSKMRLRRLGEIDPMLAAYCEYNGTIYEIPISEYPIKYGY